MLDKEQRVKFKKGMQRKFLELTASRLNCISIRGILQFGFDIPYPTLKNYYIERRLLPKSFYDSLCHLGKISSKEFNVEFVNGNWGQVKGGRVRPK